MSTATPERAVFLLVAGFAQNRRAFLEGPLPAALIARGARVFIGEIRGHGLSRGDRPPPRWTIRSHVEHDLPALVGHVRRLTAGRRIHYLGHSLGGLLALAWLAEPQPVAGLVTMATPLRIGSDRRIVRRAARVAGAVNATRLWRQVPMHGFLRGLSRTLSAPSPDPVRRWFQRYAALASPEHAPPAALETVLANADPESPEVFGELLRMARRGSAELAGYDLLASARRLTAPWIAIHGGRDIFAPPSSVAVIETEHHRGPRSIIEIPDVTHVDVAIGHHVDALIERCWNLLFPVDIA